MLDNPQKVYYLDEASFNCGMRARYGWSTSGERANVQIRNLREKSLTVCAVLSYAGYLKFDIHEGGYTGRHFSSFIQSLILEFAFRGIDNAVVIMDNAPIHKWQSNAATLLSNAGHRLIFLPPYSPFLNPIEESFSKWKGLVRRSNCRNEEELTAAIHNSHIMINASDAEGFYRHTLSYYRLCFARSIIEN